MGVILWLVIVVGILASVVSILAVWMLQKRKTGGGKRETNYRAFFITGAIMTPIGLFFLLLSIMRDYSFFPFLPVLSIGIVYLTIGWGGKDKRNQK